MELKDEIDRIVSPLLTFGGEEFCGKVEGLVAEFLGSLEEVVGTLRRALLFMLMKVNCTCCTHVFCMLIACSASCV